MESLSPSAVSMELDLPERNQLAAKDLSTGGIRGCRQHLIGSLGSFYPAG